MLRPAPTRASALAFLATAALLGPVQLLVAPPMLLAERFVPGLGWLEVLALSAYAAWLAPRLLDPRTQPAARRLLWSLFAVVFFAQLLLGLAGIDAMLMTGRLHLPVPAVVLAGPVYRGERFFMAALVGASALLTGPAFCSHLCYLGALDAAQARARRRPLPLPRWAPRARLAILLAVVAASALLRAAGASWVLAGGAALAFGLGGVAVTALASRRLGVMAHCAVYCPLGLAVDLLGRLSPFRLRIREGCTSCGACERVCRYDALRPADLEARAPGPTCSLCGDCVGACRERLIELRFPGLSPGAARTLFVVLVTSLHAAFLGVARM